MNQQDATNELGETEAITVPAPFTEANTPICWHPRLSLNCTQEVRVTELCLTSLHDTYRDGR
jgi:hypothetical protein